jgi:hypothetical protein
LVWTVIHIPSLVENLGGTADISRDARAGDSLAERIHKNERQGGIDAAGRGNRTGAKENIA